MEVVRIGSYIVSSGVNRAKILFPERPVCWSALSSFEEQDILSASFQLPCLLEVLNTPIIFPLQKVEFSALSAADHTLSLWLGVVSISALEGILSSSLVPQTSIEIRGIYVKMVAHLCRSPLDVIMGRVSFIAYGQQP